MSSRKSSSRGRQKRGILWKSPVMPARIAAKAFFGKVHSGPKLLITLRSGM